MIIKPWIGLRVRWVPNGVDGTVIDLCPAYQTILWDDGLTSDHNIWGANVQILSKPQDNDDEVPL